MVCSIRVRSVSRARVAVLATLVGVLVAVSWMAHRAGQRARDQGARDEWLLHAWCDQKLFAWEGSWLYIDEADWMPYKRQLGDDGEAVELALTLCVQANLELSNRLTALNDRVASATSYRELLAMRSGASRLHEAIDKAFRKARYESRN